MRATLTSSHVAQPRSLLLRIVLITLAWIAAPYVVYLAFGSRAGNGAAALGLMGWAMGVLIPVIKQGRLWTREGAKGFVYVFVLFSFIAGLGCTTLYLWLCD